MFGSAGYLVERGWENHETLPESLELTFLKLLIRKITVGSLGMAGSRDLHVGERIFNGFNKVIAW